MAIKKTDTGWLVDAQPAGRGGKRHRKTFKTQAEAKQWEAWLKTQVNQNPKWQPEKRDLRKLAAIVELWYQAHGSNLRAGVDTRKRLLKICTDVGNPTADMFTAEVFAVYRTNRLEQGITANNMNRELAYMKAVFNELIWLGLWKKENPLKQIRAFKIQERELSYLTLEQIEILLSNFEAARNQSVKLVAEVCLATGARWGEAEGLRRSQITKGLIQFVQTKSSKSRSIPIDKELEGKLIKHHAENKGADRLFEPAWGAFREAVERAGLILPEGQMTHVLRHTFASHFMMNGGNILALQKILGHHSLTMTMRYSHLSPEHLQEVKAINPLTKLREKIKLR